ncbi:cytochrome c maturation protein CcmE [Alphaproteobacteria bacterium]|nr:cytochrome c maturation protein CcmE [Alphaproteobacteria bacterium]
MTIRFQRLLLILFSLIFLTSAILLILFNSKKNLVFFFTPSELLNSDHEINDIVRIGGFVEKNSIINKGNNSYSFLISDNNNRVLVEYSGILPDLFREEQGVVIQGKLKSNFTIYASTVFAKHDENYMPASIKKQLQTNQYWKKNYK